MEEPGYSQEDAQAILRRALTRQAQAGEVPREQLLQMASELGISEKALLSAERQWLAERGEQEARRQFLAGRRREFRDHALTYAAVNAFLLLLNVFTSGTISWAIFPLLGWGLALFFHALHSRQTEGEEFEKEFARWRKRRDKDDEDDDDDDDDDDDRVKVKVIRVPDR